MCVCSLFCWGIEVCCPLWSLVGDFVIVLVALFCSMGEGVDVCVSERFVMLRCGV